jgi:outer membrane receptor protein involved in Fe transport
MAKSSMRSLPLLAVAMAVRAALVQAAAPADASAEAPIATEATLDVAVPGGLTMLDEVTIEGRGTRNVQQAVTEVVSVLSAEDIARTGEGDIAGALAFVPGLSVVGGGFVYVRGLGDRYSLALLNGSPLPSPEPLRRAIPLDLFPTDLMASSLVQKTYSPNYPGEFGGGVINLTTLAVPRMSFLNAGVGISGDTVTTARTGYDHFGGKYDWTGYDGGVRDLPSGLAVFFDSGQRISSLDNEQTAAIASQFVGWRNGLVQTVNLPINWSGSLTGGNSWSLGDGEMGVIGTAGFSNKWRTRDNLEQTPGAEDLSAVNKDVRSVASENRIVGNALLGFGYQNGANRVRWTNLYIHDTLKRTSLSDGKWLVDYGDTDLREQNTAWYERELLNTQLTGSFDLNPVTVNFRGSYATSSRKAPFELGIGYSRSNNPDTVADPYGQYFVNLLSGQAGNFANIAFSDLTEDLYSGGLDLSWRIMPGYVLSAGVDRSDTRRDASRREFLFRAEDLPPGVGMLRPDYLLSPEIITHYQIDLQESTETAAAFNARLVVNAAYLQLQAMLVPGIEFAAGARYEKAGQDVSPVEVFTTPTNTGLPTHLVNDYVLPAGTLTWKFGSGEDKQIRVNASKTIARPQFRELMFQSYFDPEGNRSYRGNPLLRDSKFLNGEARFEWYFNPDERFSMAGFYKKIDHPIEAYTSFPQGSTPETSFANAPEATLYGAEFELQKHFALGDWFEEGGALTGFLAQRRLVMIGNYTYTTSEIRVREGDTTSIPADINTPATDLFQDGAKLTGQSDHLVNLQLGLEHPDRLSQITLLLSYASDRVTSRVVQWFDIKESPGFKADVVARQGFMIGERMLELKLEARNIFGRGYSEFQRNGSNVVYYNKYEVGTSFGLSLSMNF